MNCRFLQMPSSHCTAFRRLIILAVTLLRPEAVFALFAPKRNGRTSAPRLLWRRVLILSRISGSARVWSLSYG